MSQKNSLVLIIDFLSNLFKLIIPAMSAFLFGYLMFRATPIISPMIALISVTSVAVLFIGMAFYLYHFKDDIYIAYGGAIAGVSLLYASFYQAYVSFALFKPIETFWHLTIIALAAAYAAVRFQGWLLAVLAIAMSLVTPSIVLVFLSRSFLAWYFVLFLLFSMLIAYWRGWFELAALSFLGFVMYNPLLFTFTDLEGKKGFLSIYQVFWIAAALFGIYTCIPYFYTLFWAKKRIFESISITVGGAYSFALVRYIIKTQLSMLEKLPFFIKLFVGKTLIMNDIHMYLFLLYGLIYALLFVLLYLVNRQAKVVLATLASLSVICTIGMFYTQTKATGILRYIMRLRRFLLQTIQVVIRQ
ncbi:MAG: DUF2339 domain-containing protein [Candidatus Dependentiae bacterium]